MASASSFVTSVIINLSLAISCFLIFIYNRTRRTWIYAPRCLQKHRTPEYPSPPCSTLNTKFGWLDTTIRMSTVELLEVAGLDAVMYIKFFSICFKIFIAMCVWMVILIPINVTAYDEDTNDSSSEWTSTTFNTTDANYKPLHSTDFNDFDMISMSVIPSGSPRMWAHLIAMYSLTLIVLYYMNETWHDYLLLRHRWLQREQQHGRHLTLMVTDIPEGVHTAEFERLYKQAYTLDAKSNSTVHCAWKLRDTAELSDVLTQRDDVLQQLEYDTIKFKQSGNRPTTRTSLCSTADAIEVNTRHLHSLNRQIERMQREIRHKNNINEFNAGFVHFSRSLACYTARHIPLTRQPHEYHVQFAPEPSDIFHPSLQMTSNTKFYRTIFTNLLVVLGVLGWAIPVVFAQSFTNLHQLSKKWPALVPLVTYNRALTGVLEGFLPSLILVVLQQILPYCLYYLSVFEGINSHSGIQMSILQKYFYFILFNFFLILTFANSILSVLSDIVDQPKRIFILLGVSIPQVSTFYISYILLRSLTLFPMQLARLVPLTYLSLNRSWFTQTPRTLHNLSKPPQIQYGTEYADHLLVFLIGIIYSCISPIILPFAALFFGLGYIVTKYQLIYVYVSQWESGGQFWPIIYPRMLIGLLVSQVTLIGLFGLKNGVHQYLACLPLPAITYWFYRRIQQKYNYKAQYLCVTECHDVDTHLMDKDIDDHCPQLRYTQPELSIEPHVEPDTSFDDHEYEEETCSPHTKYEPYISDRRESSIEVNVQNEQTPLLSDQQKSPKYA